MNTYSSPQVTELGNIQALTGIFGSSSQPDILVGPNGQTVETGTGSIDACPTTNQQSCNINTP